MIYVDSCCNNFTGNNAYASVIELKDGERIDLLQNHYELFDDMILKKIVFPIGEFVIIVAHSSDVVSQHNNYGELLAFIAGLRIAIKINSKYLHSDSDLVIKYWSQKISKTVKDPLKRKYIEECIKLRKIFEQNGGQIIKVPGSDNPSDLGFHK